MRTCMPVRVGMQCRCRCFCRYKCIFIFFIQSDYRKASYATKCTPETVISTHQSTLNIQKILQRRAVCIYIIELIVKKTFGTSIQKLCYECVRLSFYLLEFIFISFSLLVFYHFIAVFACIAVYRQTDRQTQRHDTHDTFYMHAKCVPAFQHSIV